MCTYTTFMVLDTQTYKHIYIYIVLFLFVILHLMLVNKILALFRFFEVMNGMMVATIVCHKEDTACLRGKLKWISSFLFEIHFCNVRKRLKGYVAFKQNMLRSFKIHFSSYIYWYRIISVVMYLTLKMHSLHLIKAIYYTCKNM